jgi:hypothetical protein
VEKNYAYNKVTDHNNNNRKVCVYNCTQQQWLWSLRSESYEEMRNVHESKILNYFNIKLYVYFFFFFLLSVLCVIEYWKQDNVPVAVCLAAWYGGCGWPFIIEWRKFFCMFAVAWHAYTDITV